MAKQLKGLCNDCDAVVDREAGTCKPSRFGVRKTEEI